MSPRKGYLCALAELFAHVTHCEECAEHRDGCDEGKDLAEYVFELSGRREPDSKVAA